MGNDHCSVGGSKTVRQEFHTDFRCKLWAEQEIQYAKQQIERARERAVTEDPKYANSIPSLEYRIASAQKIIDSYWP